MYYYIANMTGDERLSRFLFALRAFLLPTSTLTLLLHIPHYALGPVTCDDHTISMARIDMSFELCLCVTYIQKVKYEDRFSNISLFSPYN